jgi:hypothetical protein
MSRHKRICIKDNSKVSHIFTNLSRNEGRYTIAFTQESAMERIFRERNNSAAEARGREAATVVSCTGVIMKHNAQQPKGGKMEN